MGLYFLLFLSKRGPCHGVRVSLSRYLFRLAFSFICVHISLSYAGPFCPPKTSGESTGSLNDPNKEALAKTEVSLTLTNKFDVPGDENSEMDARTILLK